MVRRPYHLPGGSAGMQAEPRRFVGQRPGADPALTSPMVLAYGALAHSQHSLAAAAAFLKAPILTAPMAAFASPIACAALAPACAMQPPLTYFVSPRARNPAPYKRPAQPTRKPAGPAKKAYSNPCN